ncbi:uncharacterized protein BT62DRAFT_1007196 [Guyanagaster necrorhizus]|uniref:Uncharacterized protein n=1 Tax=Guyanagaster necrorhizus TaxID=856835 RepID=A0A9P8ARQ6_9AGAR|nr:uncharacterized protein BT62DRAFT_1007196 [Guyanagaster necrorhizus MCA 3950]KAG7445444.1 hypothetical protein BT62DRAFT_1007196 [Guyanagaster necrorhizus MCA 3950]
MNHWTNKPGYRRRVLWSYFSEENMQKEKRQRQEFAHRETEMVGVAQPPISTFDSRPRAAVYDVAGNLFMRVELLELFPAITTRHARKAVTHSFKFSEIAITRSPGPAMVIVASAVVAISKNPMTHEPIFDPSVRLGYSASAIMSLTYKLHRILAIQPQWKMSSRAISHARLAGIIRIDETEVMTRVLVEKKNPSWWDIHTVASKTLILLVPHITSISQTIPFLNPRISISERN